MRFCGWWRDARYAGFLRCCPRVPRRGINSYPSSGWLFLRSRILQERNLHFLIGFIAFLFLPNLIGRYYPLLQWLARACIAMFVVSLIYAVVTCPPANCLGEQSIIYVLPFAGAVIFLPLSIVLYAMAYSARKQHEYKEKHTLPDRDGRIQ